MKRHLFGFLREILSLFLQKNRSIMDIPCVMGDYLGRELRRSPWGASASSTRMPRHNRKACARRAKAGACFLLILTLSNTLTACVPLVAAGAATSVAVINDRRSTGTIIDDQGIELKAIHELSKHSCYQENRIVVTSYNNTVLVTGQVATAQQKEKVADLLRQIPEVKKVYNELTLGKPTGMQQRLQDSWITSKIKTQLFTHKTVSASQIKVITENANVYLMGLISEEEALQATALVKDIANVEKITRVFEYTHEE